MARVLVIANQTAVSSQLLSRVKALGSVDPDMSVYVVVPATEPRDQPRNDYGKPLHADFGRKLAEGRLEQVLESFRRLGIEIDGQVGSADPMQAAEAAMTDGSFNLIVVSTLAPGVSRWLKMDLPHRLERRYKLPVEHVIGDAQISDSMPSSSVSAMVLLVEDQPADVALTKLAIESTKVNVDLRIAGNGEEALELLRGDGVYVFDLILLDLKMPVLDGHQFLEKLADDEKLPAQNVVVLTTSTGDVDRERAHELGAAAYVVKDPDFDVFRSTIESLIVEVAHV